MITKKDRNKILIFSIIILILPILLKSLKGGNYYIGVLIPIGLFSLTAIGLNLLIGFAGQISLGHAAFITIGAYSSVFICTKLGLNAILGILFSILINAILGYLISKPILKLKGHYLAMATLGIGIIIQILFREFNYLGAGEGISIPDLILFGYNFNTFETKEISYYYLVWIINLLVLLCIINLINSKVGRALKAIHINELAAQSLGVNITRYKTFVFMLSVILAGISGSIFAHYNSYVLPFSFNLHTSIKLVTMVILGGTISIWGAIIGTFILMILPEVLGSLEEYEGIINGMVLILTMIFLPEGLISLKNKFKKKI